MKTSLKKFAPWTLFLLITLSPSALQIGFAEPTLSLFTWKPSEGSVPLILPRIGDEDFEKAATRYLRAYNEKPALKRLSDGKLEINLEGFSELPAPRADHPRMVVLANEPQQFRGSQGGKSWLKPLVRAGAEVFVLPPVADGGLTRVQAKRFRQLVAKEFQGMLAIGGDDVEPRLYGQRTTHAENTCAERDQSEMEMIRAYYEAEHGMLFGICRGMQLISVTLGYPLIQDIGKLTDNSTNHYDDHRITLLDRPGSFLKKLFGRDAITIYSAHHQAVDIDPETSRKRGPLIVTALNEGKEGEKPIVEAVQLRNGHGFAIQGHPERMGNETGRKIMREMVRLAKEVKSARRSRCEDDLRAR